MSTGRSSSIILTTSIIIGKSSSGIIRVISVGVERVRSHIRDKECRQLLDFVGSLFQGKNESLEFHETFNLKI